jgi:hypothetical protein
MIRGLTVILVCMVAAWDWVAVVILAIAVTR